MASMDVRQIRYFLAVADARSFLRAAKDLNLSQPALSKAIKSLEHSVGVRLLNRGIDGVSLTAFGERLYNYGKTLIVEMERITNELRAERKGPSGSVTIGCPRTVAHLLLPEVTTKFSRNHPTVSTRIVVGYNTDLIAGVVRGDFDFVIGVVQGGLDEYGLRHEFLFNDRLVIVGRAGHPLSREKKITPAVLAKYPWTLSRNGTQYRQRFDDMFLAAGLQPPPSNIECGDITYIRSLLVQSDFLALVSEQSVSFECEHGILTSFPVDYHFVLRPIGLLFHPYRPLTLAARALVEQVRMVCRERRVLGSGQVSLSVPVGMARVGHIEAGHTRAARDVRNGKVRRKRRPHRVPERA